jgi:hypothetical protein
MGAAADHRALSGRRDAVSPLVDVGEFRLLTAVSWLTRRTRSCVGASCEHACCAV